MALDRVIVKRFRDSKSSTGEIVVSRKTNGSYVCTCHEFTYKDGCQHLEVIRRIEAQNMEIFGDSHIPSEDEIKEQDTQPRRFGVRSKEIRRRVYDAHNGFRPAVTLGKLRLRNRR